MNGEAQWVRQPRLPVGVSEAMHDAILKIGRLCEIDIKDKPKRAVVAYEVLARLIIDMPDARLYELLGGE